MRDDQLEQLSIVMVRGEVYSTQRSIMYFKLTPRSGEGASSNDFVLQVLTARGSIPVPFLREGVPLLGQQVVPLRVL